MTLIRQHSKSLLFVVATLLIWAQYITTDHDLRHQHVNDDCVVCKIVQVGSDRLNVENFQHKVYLKSEFVSFNFIEVFLVHNIWETSLSRAPPHS